MEFGRIFERRNLALAVVVGLGGLGLAGCSGTIHGMGGAELVNCDDGPKTNEVDIRNFTKGQTIELGKDIDTYMSGEGNGDAIKGSIQVKSLGNGEFDIRFRSDSEGENDGDSVARLHGNPDHPVTVSDHEQQYAISAVAAGNNADGLTIAASCTN